MNRFDRFTHLNNLGKCQVLLSVNVEQLFLQLQPPLHCGYTVTEGFPHSVIYIVIGIQTVGLHPRSRVSVFYSIVLTHCKGREVSAVCLPLGPNHTNTRNIMYDLNPSTSNIFHVNTADTRTLCSSIPEIESICNPWLP